MYSDSPIQAALASYARAVQRTASSSAPDAAQKMGPVGLCSEAGELLDLCKKVWFQGHELNRDKFIKEMGDVLWYFQHTLTSYGISWDEVVRKNVAKLQERYPAGFSAIDSQIRADTLEEMTPSTPNVFRTGREL